MKATVWGIALLFAHLALFWPLLGAGRDELGVVIEVDETAGGRLEVRARLERPALAARTRLLVDRVPVEARFDSQGALRAMIGPVTPGLHAVCAEARYGGGRVREACRGALVGPRERARLAAGALRVFVPARMIEELGPIASKRLRRTLAENAAFLKLRRAVVKLTIAARGVRARGRVVLADGSVLAASVAIEASGAGVRLALRRRGPVRVAVRGPAARWVGSVGAEIGGAIGELLGDKAGRDIGRVLGAALAGPAVDALLRHAVERVLDREVLPGLASALAFPAEIDLGPEWGGERLAVRYGGPPRWSPGQGVELRLDAGLVGPTAGPGWVRVAGPPPSVAGTDLLVDVSPDLANALLYGLWARGRLRALANRPARLAEWDARLTDLVVRPAAIDFLSAPVMQASDDGADLALADVALRLVPRAGGDVATEGRLFLRLGLGIRWNPESRALEVAGRTRDVALSCEAAGLLRPCFSDAVRIAREELGRPDAGLLQLIGLSVDRLNPLAPGPGAEIVLDVASVAPSIARGWMRLGLQARLRDTN